MTDDCAHTVIARISTADDYHMLSLRIHIGLISKIRIQKALGIRL